MPRDLPETDLYWSLVERSSRCHFITVVAIAALMTGGLLGLVTSLFTVPTGTFITVSAEVPSLAVICVTFPLSAIYDSRINRLRARIAASAPVTPQN